MKPHPSILRPYILLGFLVAASAAATPQRPPGPKVPLECEPRTPLVAATDSVTVLPAVHVRAKASVPEVLPRVHVTASSNGFQTAHRVRDRANSLPRQPGARAFR